MSYSEKPNFMKNFFIWFGIYLLITAVVYSGGYLIFSAIHKQELPISSHLRTTPSPATPFPSTTPANEKQQINTWIQKNNLNQYGDPKDTIYPGGTPLFNEATGKTIDRYEYIENKHPDRPWQK